MATIKVACPRCGQKVSGDESFFGTTVECPICSSSIQFPGQKHEGVPKGELKAESPDAKITGETASVPISADSAPSKETRSTPLPGSDFEAAPQASRPETTEIERRAAREAEEEDERIAEEPPSPIFGAISIVSAVIAVVTCGIAGPLFAPLAIIFGHTALAKARHSPVHPAPGQTLGAIGLMIGYVSLLITILVLVVLVFFGDTIRGYLPAVER